MKASAYPQIRLNRRGLKKVLQGRLWLTFEDCIEDRSHLQKTLSPGSLVTLISETGEFLAQGYCNPQVFFAIKILTRRMVPIDSTFFHERLSRALNLRKRLFPNSKVFRLVHGEGDFLPGLIIDIYEDLAVIQCHTQGMEKLLSLILDALRRVISLRHIFVKNDFERRKEEGLPLYTIEDPEGIPDPYEVEIDGIKFLIPLKAGQKTGFFLDQRQNRKLIAPFCRDLVVIDGFSYIGAFAMYALREGAKRVFIIDRSKRAIDLALEIARINRFHDRVIPIEGDLFKVLRGFSDRIDFLILDPPAFIKRNEDKDRGLNKYRELIGIGTGLFRDREGFMTVFSCSHFLSSAELEDLCRLSLIREGLQGQILQILSQAMDHPVNPFVEETRYLKGLLLKLTRI